MFFLFFCLFCFVFFFCCIFFFQAEDGIRDLVRSRGLGDVYKRQLGHRMPICVIVGWTGAVSVMTFMTGVVIPHKVISVSYTHLTLPTSDLV